MRPYSLIIFQTQHSLDKNLGEGEVGYGGGQNAGRGGVGERALKRFCLKFRFH